MKRVLAVLLTLVTLLALLAGCAQSPDPETSAEGVSGEQLPAAEPASPDEEYVFMMCQANVEYWNQHKNAMYAATKELGCKYSIVGVESADATDICTALETVISQKPAGIVISGWFPDAFVPIFEKAWEAGVPIATVTTDVPGSRRICFLGTDYYEYGKIMAEQGAIACDGEGKVLLVGNLNSGNPAQVSIHNGIHDLYAEKYPNIEIVNTLEDEADTDVCVQVVSSALLANPDTDVIIGTDAISAIGSVTSLRETGLEGEVKIIGMDRDAPTLEAIRDGTIYATVAGKQYAEVYYAVKMLYDYNHNKVPLVADNKASGVIAQPTFCDPGAVVITADNVESFLSYDINEILDPDYK